jgi:hypothetical protein
MIAAMATKSRSARNQIMVCSDDSDDDDAVNGTSARVPDSANNPKAPKAQAKAASSAPSRTTTNVPPVAPPGMTSSELKKVMLVGANMTSMQAAIEKGELERKDEQKKMTEGLEKLKQMVEKGYEGSPGDSATSRSHLSLSDVSSLLDRATASTKSECLSSASTLINDALIKDKEKIISTQNEKIKELEAKLDGLTVKFTTAYGEAEKFKSALEQAELRVTTVKTESAHWKELSDQLRRDIFEMFKNWYGAK